MRQIVVALLAFALLPGCSEAPPLAASKSAVAAFGCTQRPGRWPTGGYPLPIQIVFPLLNEIEVGADGSYLWNGRQIAPAELALYLRVADTIFPPYFVVLRTTPASPCEATERVRALMDGLRACREFQVCYEGAAWDATGRPRRAR